MPDLTPEQKQRSNEITWNPQGVKGIDDAQRAKLLGLLSENEDAAKNTVRGMLGGGALGLAGGAAGGLHLASKMKSPLAAALVAGGSTYGGAGLGAAAGGYVGHRMDESRNPGLKQKTLGAYQGYGDELAQMPKAAAYNRGYQEALNKLGL